jgi:hypothetical protein
MQHQQTKEQMNPKPSALLAFRWHEPPTMRECSIGAPGTDRFRGRACDCKQISRSSLVRFLPRYIFSSTASFADASDPRSSSCTHARTLPPASPALSRVRRAPTPSAPPRTPEPKDTRLHGKTVLRNHACDGDRRRHMPDDTAVAQRQTTARATAHDAGSIDRPILAAEAAERGGKRRSLPPSE